MATWKRVSGEPLTVESEVRVFNLETGEEGYISITWENRYHKPRFFGSVFKIDRFYDSDGCEIEEPKETILDENPTFA